MIDIARQWILTAVGAGLLALAVWALIGALRFRPDAYVAADRRTKGFWSLLTALALLLAVLGAPLPLLMGVRGGSGSMLFLVASAVISGVFLADVMPALRRVMERARGNRW